MRLLTYRKHLIGLIEDKHLHRLSLQNPALDHVVHAAGSSNNDLGAILDRLDVVTNSSATNASMGINVHEITDGDDNLLDLLRKLTSGGENQGLALLELGINVLENRDGEGGSLAGTRLCLCDHITTFGMSDAHSTLSGVGSCLPWMTGMIARCWIADGRSKP